MHFNSNFNKFCVLCITICKTYVMVVMFFSLQLSRRVFTVKRSRRHASVILYTHGRELLAILPAERLVESRDKRESFQM